MNALPFSATRKQHTYITTCISLPNNYKIKNRDKELPVDVQTQISKGDLVLSPGEDLLTKVIGPEHPGRTRAVVHDVGLRKGMQGTNKKRGKNMKTKLLINCRQQ
uniref:Uncharacterized protein n=1 Tax=Lactuca sativa TaxID=4236 RepID=A0A9R1VMQ0_LACSA|nr:hypothetical protein LSAT_V11C500228790 [Lactuca sativa]